MNVEFNVLDRQFLKYKSEYEDAAIKVLNSAWYITGEEGQNFESEFATFCNSKYCVGLNSGLDALILALKTLDIKEGDEVIVPANTYIATVLAITENLAKPVFVEPDEFYNIDVNKIEAVITNKTKVIMPVHLYGQACNMKKISELAIKYNLYIIEDCAQSHYACFDGKTTGTFSDIGCFSFYPTKNLGAFGDAGAIITDNLDYAEKIMMMRNYGSKIKYYNEIQGVNSRLDEIQAALLSLKLKHIQELTDERIYIANRYLKEICNDKILLPKKLKGADHVYHLFVVQCESRDALQQYLLDNNIKTQIHYPIPPHLATCYKHLGYKEGDFPITENYSKTILSLPLYNGMNDDEITYVVDVLNKF